MPRVRWVEIGPAAQEGFGEGEGEVRAASIMAAIWA
jgi:hypothetical protein